MTLNPSRLRILDVFERLGTVRATAEELHLSPSTVSQQLAMLEGEAGAALFERRGRTLSLAPAGLLLVRRARELLDRMDAISAELTDATAEPTGRVLVGGFASSIASLLVPAATWLAAEHPRLELELVEIEPREATAAIHLGRLDLVVTVDESDGTLLDPTLSVVQIASDPLLVVLPHGHPLAARASVSFTDLTGERWALDHAGTYLGELVPRECRRAGFEPVVVGRFSSYGVMIEHVAAGRSIAVLPELAVDGRARVESRPIDGLEDRRIVVASRSGSAARPAVRAVVEALSRSAAVSGSRVEPPRSTGGPR